MRPNIEVDILYTAKELFNIDGIQVVNMRDIAEKVNISVGNLTYHFPTKDNLVHALCKQMEAEIDVLLKAAKVPYTNALKRHYNLMDAALRIHCRYRFLFDKRYGEVITGIPELQQYYQGVLIRRFEFWADLHRELVKEKLAKANILDESVPLGYMANILIFYWHQEYNIYLPGFREQQRIDYAISVHFQALKPYLTRKGLQIYNALIVKLQTYHIPSQKGKLKTIKAARAKSMK